MNKELAPLKAHKELKSRYGKYFSLQDDERAKIIETALKRLEDLEKWFLDDKDYKKCKALEIIKESIGIKISVDEDLGCLYVPITRCFQPLEQNIVIVGYVKGKEKIDLLKEVLL